MIYLPVFIIMSMVCSQSMNLPQREQIAYHLMDDFSQNLHIPGLRAIGSGLKGDKIYGKLGVLDVCFETDEVLTINSARALCVECIDRFITYLSDKQELAPHLTKFPVSREQVAILITGADAKEGPFIKTVIGRAGKIRYFDKPLGPPTFGFICEDTYEEAVSKLKNS